MTTTNNNKHTRSKEGWLDKHCRAEIMAVSDGEQGTPPLEQLRDCLLDRSQPIAKRTHSAFFLRTLGTAEAVSAVGEGMYVIRACLRLSRC